jgi:heme exporter protein CcmD
MGYVIAAYGVTLAAILLYLGNLIRERRRLRRELETG